MGPHTTATLFAGLSDLGVHHTVAPGTSAAVTEWLTVQQLTEQIARRVAHLATRLGATRSALAASMLGRSIVPLVVTPTAVAWSYWRTIPDFGPDNLRIGMTDGAVCAIGMERPRLVKATGDDPAWFRTEVVAGVCEPVIQALRSTARLGERHLWGNVALAIAAPFASLLATGRHDGRRDRDAMLRSRPELAGLVEVIDVAAGDRPLEAVRRRTCCLLTRLPEPHGAMCGTCPLHPRAEHVVRLADYYRRLGEQGG